MSVAEQRNSRRSYPVAARELLRTMLLDAGRELVAERPFSAVTMAQIARRAGVSRQTLYNEFGSREGFAQALLLREADRFLTEVEGAVNEHRNDPERALAAAFEVFLVAAAEDPIVRSGLREGAEELLALATARGRPLVEHAVERLAAVISSNWPAAPREDCQLLAECLVRLAISYATLPKEPSQIAAKAVARLLGPYIQRVLGETS